MPLVNQENSGDTATQEEAPIPAEVLAAIAAAAAVFVGKRLHIRSIEQLHSARRPVNRWSRQGRVLVQASHNLPVRH
jgi:hypothetical protein